MLPSLKAVFLGVPWETRPVEADCSKLLKQHLFELAAGWNNLTPLAEFPLWRRRTKANRAAQTPQRLRSVHLGHFVFPGTEFLLQAFSVPLMSLLCICLTASWRPQRRQPRSIMQLLFVPQFPNSAKYSVRHWSDKEMWSVSGCHGLKINSWRIISSPDKKYMLNLDKSLRHTVALSTVWSPSCLCICICGAHARPERQRNLTGITLCATAVHFDAARMENLQSKAVNQEEPRKTHIKIRRRTSNGRLYKVCVCVCVTAWYLYQPAAHTLILCEIKSTNFVLEVFRGLISVSSERLRCAVCEDEVTLKLI